MKNLFLKTLVFLSLISCNKISEKLTEISNKNEFYSAIDDSNKITFKINKTTKNRAVREEYSFETKPSHFTENTKQISEFRGLFDNVKSTGYCCCPNADLKIEFYNKDSVKDYFFLDSTTIEDSVIIFQKSYQFSKKISKVSWDDYLMKLKK